MLATLAILPGVDWLRQYRYTWAAARGSLLVLSTFIFGVDPNGSGARLWLGFGGVYFQPSEVLKVLLVVFFAAYLDDYRELLTLCRRSVSGRCSLPPLPYLAPLLVHAGARARTGRAPARPRGRAAAVRAVPGDAVRRRRGRVHLRRRRAGAVRAGATLLYRLFSVVKLRVETWLDPWANGRDDRLPARAGADGAGGRRGVRVGAQRSGTRGTSRPSTPTS